MAGVLINVPRSVRRGQLIEVRALIRHPMETGFRPDASGTLLPRDIITRFTCAYDGEVVFSAELSPAIAANPFLSFTTLATESGALRFTWEGDNGFSQTESRLIEVT